MVDTDLTIRGAGDQIFAENFLFAFADRVGEQQRPAITFPLKKVAAVLTVVQPERHIQRAVYAQYYGCCCIQKYKIYVYSFASTFSLLALILWSCRDTFNDQVWHCRCPAEEQL